MKKFWKVLGITAAVAALAPYRINKDEETGEKKVEALLWRATAAPKDGEEKVSVDVSFGFQSPFAPRSGEPLFDEEPVAEFQVPAEEQVSEEQTEAEQSAEEQAGETQADEDAAEAEVQAVEAGIQAAEAEKTQDAENAGDR